MSEHEPTYWGHNGKYQVYVNQLNDLIPVEGSVDRPYKNKALERFRKASNCYYDLYNNGLYNRAREFAGIFGIRSSDHRYNIRSRHYYGPMFDANFYKKVEAVMDQIVLAAAVEQKMV